MHRIDGAGATTDNRFTGGNPASATPATVVTNDWLNAVQEEIAAVILDSSIDPPMVLDKTKNNQLAAAIKKIAAKFAAASQATETVLGAAKIATQTKVNEGADDNDMVTSKKLAVRLSSVFGNGQSYVNVTASRSAGVSYTNSTTRPILVMLSIATVVGAETVAIVVDGETIYSGDPGVNGQILPFTFVVAAGKSYSVSITSSTVINRWVEYR